MLIYRKYLTESKFDSYGVFYSLSGIKIGTVDSQGILRNTKGIKIGEIKT